MAWWIMGAAPLSNVTAPPGLTNSAPQFIVNRFRKGDRLSMTRNPAVSHDLPMSQNLQSGKKLQLGCDPVLGPIAAKSIYGRCMV